MASTCPALNAQLATAKQCVDALPRRDLETIRKCVTEDFVWDVPGNSRLAGDRHGWAEWLEMLQLAQNLSNGTFHSEPVDLTAAANFCRS